MNATQDTLAIGIPELKAQYDAQGFALARGLFSPAEVEFLKSHFMELRARGSHPGDMVAETELKAAVDPLKKFPRMIHMHRWDEASLQFLHGKDNREARGRSEPAKNLMAGSADSSQAQIDGLPLAGTERGF